MRGRRFHVGKHLAVLAETPDGLHLEGPARLRPGQPVELVIDGPPGEVPRARSAWVLSWSVSRLGKEGPTYHGHCRWQ